MVSKKNIGYVYVFIVLCMTSAYSFGFVYEFFVMQKNSVVQGKSQIIVGIGDYHDKNHSANADQRAYLEYLIKKSKDSKLIVEDLSSVNDDGRHMCCNYMINSSGGFLGKLADVGRNASIAVNNVEYRYCRVAGIGPLLNNIEKKPQAFATSTTITIDDLAKEVLDEIEKIKQYNDSSFLNSLYKRTAMEVTKSFKELQFDKAVKQTAAEYCSRLFNKHYSKFLEKVCIFDSPLIDMKIMHSIFTSADKHLIVIAAGGSHIDKVSKILSSMGYKTILSSSHNGLEKSFVENAFSSDKKKGEVLGYPSAVDLKVLDKFFN